MINGILFTRISLIAVLVIRIGLLAMRSNWREFFLKECVTPESLEKNHYFKNSYYKIENYC